MSMHFDQLEKRSLLSGTNLNGEVYRVFGDNDVPDDISVALVEGNLIANINGVDQDPVSAAEVNLLVVLGLSGDDTLAVAGNLELRVRIRAGEGGDTVTGPDSRAYLGGGPGDDAITGSGFLNGGPGNDTLTGGALRDFLFCGAGDDEAHGGDKPDRILGDTGNDILHGDAGDDVIAGNKHNDQIFGDAGNDQMFGLLGSDTLDGSEGDGEGVDTIWGGLAPDTFVNTEGDEVHELDFAGVRDLIDRIRNAADGLR